MTSKAGRGGRRTAPYAFTEQGVAMLSSVLRGPRAVRVNIEIMHVFVRLRRILASNAEAVFQAIRELDGLTTYAKCTLPGSETYQDSSYYRRFRSTHNTRVASG